VADDLLLLDNVPVEVCFNREGVGVIERLNEELEGENGRLGLDGSPMCGGSKWSSSSVLGMEMVGGGISTLISL